MPEPNPSTQAVPEPAQSARAETVLVVCADPDLLEQASGTVAAGAGPGWVLRARDADSARRLLAEETPDVLVLDAAAADSLANEMAQQEYAPPIIVVGPGDVKAGGIFGRAATAAELPAWLGAALLFRRLQRETKFVREESERIHSGLLKSYGVVAEHSHELEEEVKRRTVQLRQYADDLERQVEERTQELQRSNTQLVQQEKMAALGALVAGIAHDMHTPIGTITSNSDVLCRSLARLRDLIASESCPESFRNSPDLSRVLGIIEEISRVNQLACDRIVGIVRSLRNFARLDEADVKTADIHEGLESTLTLVQHELKRRITVKKEYGEIPSIQCHPNQLNQVFMNMLVNAAHAIEGAGAITIRTFREGGYVKIQFSDTGTGIKPENLPKIFDPGFTTKGVGVGTGLGLAICYRIIQDHKGQIDVESEVERGTTFTITLPIEWKTSD